MTSENPAATRVAAFEILFTQYIDAEGHVRAPLPAFAQDAETMREMYRTMVRVRAFDRKAVALQRTGQLGTYAACLGQEAVGTAIGLTLRKDDVYIPAYREYAANMLRGVPLQNVLLYWGGDERGMCYPEGTAAHHDFPFSVPIATHVPHAIGVAYSFRLRKQDRVVLASCGDGATSKGDFYEAISSAKVWNLPVVFLVSNNQWAISLPSSRQTGAQTFAQKAFAGGMHGEQCDGNDIVATREILARAIERARSGGGPSLIEAVTYRLHDHTTADDARRYRSEDEVKAAWQRCPIKRLKAYLTAQQWWSEADEAQLADDATANAEQIAQAFLAMQPDTPSAIFDSLYAKLPRQYEWQRDEVVAAGSKGGHH